MESIEKLGGEDVGREVSAKQVALASSIGATVEWYDFFLYGTASALVFNRLFFPNFDPLVGTLSAFLTLGSGFVARPVGGVIFGHYGDKVGRKSMLIITLLLMGISTVLVGLLPTYSTIGAWAPILLVVLRLIQGLAIGGEWGGAVLMAVEYAPRGKRGFYGSLPQIGAPAGLLLGTAIFTVFAALPDEKFLTWGWRVPFLISIILVVVGFLIRFKILETPAFTRVKETNTRARMPIIDVLHTHPKNILLSIGARLAEGLTFNIFGFFVLTYGAQQLGLPKSTVLIGVLAAAALECLTVPVLGALSDRVGRRPIYMGGAAFLVLYAFPFFWLFDARTPIIVWFAVVLGLAVGHGAMWSTQASFFSELFGTRVRYSGVSLSYQLSGLFSSAPAAAVSTALLIWSGGHPWPVAVYVGLFSLISLISVYLASETFRSEIYEELHNGGSDR